MNIFLTSVVVVVKVECEWNSLDSLKPRITQVVITENKKKHIMFENPCLWRFCLSKQSYDASLSLPPCLPRRDAYLLAKLGKQPLFSLSWKPSRKDWINPIIFLSFVLQSPSLFLILFSWCFSLAYFPNIWPIFPESCGHHVLNSEQLCCDCDPFS